jgi:hypothetical protein
MLGLFEIAGDPYPITTRGAVCLQDDGKAQPRDAALEISRVLDYLGKRNSDAFLPGHFYESSSRVHNRETRRRT